jgi:acetolactate synthase-1/2/3 large subunit
VGDIADTLERLCDGLAPTPAWDFTGFDSLRRALADDLLAGSEDEHFPVRPARLVADVRAVLPPEGIVALDNGIYKLWFARGYRAAVPNTVLLDNALATMGAGLPVAMAARLVHPGRPVVAVCGDGGFLMNDQELETAVRLKLDLVILILNDGGYGMVKWKQAAMQLGNFALDFKNPCFRTLAQAYGASGHRLAATAELAPLLRHCLATGGVHLIDVPVDYSVNERLLSTELARRTARGVVPEIKPA